MKYLSSDCLPRPCSVNILQPRPDNGTQRRPLCRCSSPLNSPRGNASRVSSQAGALRPASIVKKSGNHFNMLPKENAAEIFLYIPVGGRTSTRLYTKQRLQTSTATLATAPARERSRRQVSTSISVSRTATEERMTWPPDTCCFLNAGHSRRAFSSRRYSCFLFTSVSQGRRASHPITQSDSVPAACRCFCRRASLLAMAALFFASIMRSTSSDKASSTGASSGPVPYADKEPAILRHREGELTTVAFPYRETHEDALPGKHCGVKATHRYSRILFTTTRGSFSWPAGFFFRRIGPVL